MPSRTVPLSPADLVLKRETRDLIADVGGQEPAARYSRPRQQAFSDFGSPNVDRFIEIDAVRDLETATRGKTGWPRITRRLAAEQNCAVVVLPDADASAGDWHQRIADLTKEHSDVAAGLMQALADGTVDARDVRDRDLLRECDEMIQIGVNLRAMLERTLGEG